MIRFQKLGRRVGRGISVEQDTNRGTSNPLQQQFKFCPIPRSYKFDKALLLPSGVSLLPLFRVLIPRLHRIKATSPTSVFASTLLKPGGGRWGDLSGG